MKEYRYVHRETPLTQAVGGGRGLVSIIVSLFCLGMLGLLLQNNSFTGADNFDFLMVFWLSSILGAFGLHQGYFGWRALFRSLLSKQPSKDTAHNPPHWQQDYSWQAEGGLYSSRKRLLAEYFKASLYVYFISPFVYLVFFQEADTSATWVKVVVGVFVLALGLVIYGLGTAWRYHYLYGNTRLSWCQLPLQPGVPFTLELHNPRLLRSQQSVDISIRLIKEVWVTSSSGGSRSTKLMYLCKYDLRQTYQPSHGRLLITACLPEDVLPNAMRSEKARYWELVIHNNKDLNWHPYLAWFFLPVYQPQEKTANILA